jgi:hypothetical protein
MWRARRVLLRCLEQLPRSMREANGNTDARAREFYAREAADCEAEAYYAARELARWAFRAVDRLAEGAN